MQTRFFMAAAAILFGAALIPVPIAAAGGNGNGYGAGGSGGNGAGNGNSDKTSVASNDAQSKNADLGSLNASNASAQGLAHAAPNSTVGQIATYLAAMTDYSTDYTTYQCYVAPTDGMNCGSIVADPDCTTDACLAARAEVEQDLADAAAALAGAANKPITQQVVDAVNANLGITVDDSVEQQVASDAALLQPEFPGPHGLY
jgi:hypothetical protein